MQGAKNLAKKSEATIINFAVKRVVPLFILWFGVFLAVLGAPKIVSIANAQDIRENFDKLADWKSLALVVCGGIAGYIAFRIGAALLSNEKDKFRSWYGADVAQEIIGAILNFSVALIYAQALGGSWLVAFSGFAIIGLCFGAWKSFCFTG
ncbi:hypothetical protein [Ralstonia holmesii]|uniref:hypothetical protein n=1 Tax=Ralstonia holmesii TaxID=3058602 RepID=UPI002930F1CB|nr:hypothetical protein [Ralstonia sp. LMG 32967]